jgi:hypothetical protein
MLSHILAKDIRALEAETIKDNGKIGRGKTVLATILVTSSSSTSKCNKYSKV